jgi:hypothetical protein
LLTNLFPPDKLYRVLFVLFVFSLPLVNPIVHGDGVGYYAYARAPLIQHSFHFEEDWRHANLNFSQSRTRPDGHLLPEEYTETGYVSNLFTIGPAMLWAPFLVLAMFIVYFLNLFGMHIPADGFSYPYILAMALGTAIYGFIGLLLSFHLVKKYLAEGWALLATIGIWWGSSLPVYMYFNPAWSHAHSAFAVALFVWFWDRTRNARTTPQWLLLGLMAGLMVDIYFPNSIFLLFPLVESLVKYRQYLGLQRNMDRELFFQNLLFVVALSVAFLPTILTRRLIFGGYFRFGSYSHLDWDWSAPHWRAVLFSSDHGLLTWTPLLALALIGLLFVPAIARVLAMYFGMAFAAFYYLISCYPYWDGMSSFGNRFFISLTPIYIFGLAAMMQRFERIFASRRRIGLLYLCTIAVFVSWNLCFIYQWGVHLIPVRGPVSFREVLHNQFYEVPRQLSVHMRHYLFGRSDMMKQIEQRDIEQLNDAPKR